MCIILKVPLFWFGGVDDDQVLDYVCGFCCRLMKCVMMIIDDFRLCFVLGQKFDGMCAI